MNFRRLQSYCFPAGLSAGVIIGMFTGKSTMGLALSAIAALLAAMQKNKDNNNV